MTYPPSVCAYCGAPAIHKDHVVPASLQRKYHQTTGKKLPLAIAGTVSSCGPCNWRKLNRRLVPPTWEHKLGEINDLIPWGSRFRVWDGNPKSDVFRTVASR